MDFIITTLTFILYILKEYHNKVYFSNNKSLFLFHTKVIFFFILLKKKKKYSHVKATALAAEPLAHYFTL
jgi:hypothetical protein